MNEQLMYKLASLDAAVTGGFRRLDEKMDRFQSDLHDTQMQTNDRIGQLDKEFAAAIAAKRTRIDGLVQEGQTARKEVEKRITDLETWKHVLVAKMTVACTAVIAVWTVLAPTVREFLGVSNG